MDVSEAFDSVAISPDSRTTHRIVHVLGDFRLVATHDLSQAAGFRIGPGVLAPHEAITGV
jgi:hypothetical protein